MLFLLFAFCAAELSARGCLEKGTLIYTSTSQKPIEQIKPGDLVLSWDGTKFKNAKVIKNISVSDEVCFEIETKTGRLTATAAHPVFINSREMKIVSGLAKGDKILKYFAGKSISKEVISIEKKRGASEFYDLIVEETGSFIGNGIIVHNKGCFLPDTEILFFDRSVKKISEVTPGDRLLAFTVEDGVVITTVNEILTAPASSYYIIATESTVINVTASHPLYTGNGRFCIAGEIKEGEGIYVFDGSRLSREIVKTKQEVKGDFKVYNLRTDNPHTFFANNAAVHNKGGCFPAGVKVAVKDGYKNIEDIKTGDTVTGYDGKKGFLPVKVLRVFSTKSEILELNTEAGNIQTTVEHPFLTAKGEYVLAGKFNNGERLAVRKDGKKISYTVLLGKKILPGEKKVYNIEVEEPNSFIAGDFIVHNKGGGGGRGGGGYRGSGSRGGGSSNGGGFVAFVFIAIPIIIIIISAQSQANNGELDYKFPLKRVEKKSTQTMKLVAFLSKNDKALDPALMVSTVKDTFMNLQTCWQAREYAPMKTLLTPQLFREHVNQLEALKRQHEIDIIDNIKVEFIKPVHIRLLDNGYKEFTAVIEASATDYYIDDRTNEYIRGDRRAASFQEFWVFQYVDGRWLLRQIDQTKESDALTDNNFVEMFTEVQLKTIFGEDGENSGVTGPGIDKSAMLKDNKIHRHLNFLVNIDKSWNEDIMKETARALFVAFYTAKEKLDAASLKDRMFKELYEKFEQENTRMKKDGLKVEYRNLCVRKADIVLLRNYADNTKDEFTVRIAAHAQKWVWKNGAIAGQDEYEIPFENYLTLGRKNTGWALKEFFGSSTFISGRKNIDEDSSGEQVEWYYTKNRAG